MTESEASIDEQTEQWMAIATRLFLATAELSEQAMAAPSLLPDWSRKHVIAHIAANAEALHRLVSWAATGVPNPMYRSAADRTKGILDGVARPSQDLLTSLHHSAAELEDACGALPAERWTASVVTAQGRTVPVSEILWIRAREVFVHAVDLDAGICFADLPPDFLFHLGHEIAAKRATVQLPTALTLEVQDSTTSWQLPGDSGHRVVVAPLPELIAYLAGRAALLSAPFANDLPALPAWI